MQHVGSTPPLVRGSAAITLLALVVGFFARLHRKALNYSEPQRYLIGQVVVSVGTLLLIVFATVLVKDWH